MLLNEDERELKAIVDILGSAQGKGLKARCDREFARQRLLQKLARMQSFVDDSMSGRSEHERSILMYKLRVEHPLYSHLTSLSSVSREYVEWSCA